MIFTHPQENKSTRKILVNTIGLDKTAYCSGARLISSRPPLLQQLLDLVSQLLALQDLVHRLVGRVEGTEEGSTRGLFFFFFFLDAGRLPREQQAAIGRGLDKVLELIGELARAEQGVGALVCLEELALHVVECGEVVERDTADTRLVQVAQGLRVAAPRVGGDEHARVALLLRPVRGVHDGPDGEVG